MTRHSSVRERGAMGSNKPHNQATSQRPAKIRYNSKYELCCRSMWCSVLNLTVLNYKVSDEKSSSASFFTTAKATSQILLEQASRRHHFLPLPKRSLRFSWSRPLVLNPTLTGLLSASKTREGAQRPPSLVSLSGNTECAGEETYCRANEYCSFEALLLREKNSLF